MQTLKNRFVTTKRCDIVEDTILNWAQVSHLPHASSFFPDPNNPEMMYLGFNYGSLGMNAEDKRKIQTFLEKLLGKTIPFQFNSDRNLHCFHIPIDDFQKKYVPKFAELINQLSDEILKPYRKKSMQDSETRLHYKIHLVKQTAREMLNHAKELSFREVNDLISALEDYEKNLDRDHWNIVIEKKKFIDKHEEDIPNEIVEKLKKWFKKLKGYHPDPTGKHQYWFIQAPHPNLYRAYNMAKGFNQFYILSKEGFRPRDDKNNPIDISHKYFDFLPFPTWQYLAIEAHIASYLRTNKPCSQFVGKKFNVNVGYENGKTVKEVKHQEDFERRVYRTLADSSKNNFFLFAKSYLSSEAEKSRREKFADFLDDYLKKEGYVPPKRNF